MEKETNNIVDYNYHQNRIDLKNIVNEIFNTKKIGEMLSRSFFGELRIIDTFGKPKSFEGKEILNRDISLFNPNKLEPLFKIKKEDYEFIIEQENCVYIILGEEGRLYIRFFNANAVKTDEGIEVYRATEEVVKIALGLIYTKSNLVNGIDTETLARWTNSLYNYKLDQRDVENYVEFYNILYYTDDFIFMTNELVEIGNEKDSVTDMVIYLNLMEFFDNNPMEFMTMIPYYD